MRLPSPPGQPRPDPPIEPARDLHPSLHPPLQSSPVYTSEPAPCRLAATDEWRVRHSTGRTPPPAQLTAQQTAVLPGTFRRRVSASQSPSRCTDPGVAEFPLGGHGALTLLASSPPRAPTGRLRGLDAGRRGLPPAPPSYPFPRPPAHPTCPAGAAPASSLRSSSRPSAIWARCQRHIQSGPHPDICPGPRKEERGAYGARGRTAGSGAD